MGVSQELRDNQSHGLVSVINAWEDEDFSNHGCGDNYNGYPTEYTDGDYLNNHSFGQNFKDKSYSNSYWEERY